MDNINDLIGDAAKQLMAQGLWCSLHGLVVADGSCEWVEISAC